MQGASCFWRYARRSVLSISMMGPMSFLRHFFPILTMMAFIFARTSASFSLGALVSRYPPVTAASSASLPFSEKTSINVMFLLAGVPQFPQAMSHMDGILTSQYRQLSRRPYPDSSSSSMDRSTSSPSALKKMRLPFAISSLTTSSGARPNCVWSSSLVLTGGSVPPQLRPIRSTSSRLT